jgi:hypothetical protein
MARGAGFGILAAHFACTAFGAYARFGGAAFGEYASFDGAAFGDRASFNDTVFKGQVELTGNPGAVERRL